MKKRSKIISGAIALLILIAVGSFFIYVSIYYRADELALAILDQEDTELVGDDLLLLSSDKAGDIGFIFYPGAKVEFTAYLPILDQIKEETNISCFLVKMPFNMAIFDANRADAIIEQYSEIDKWYIGGHSMGGAMASDYAAQNPDKVEGLILMGAYIYGDYPDENTLTIYGTLNSSVAEKIDYSENIIAIEGGNHAQFGNYGKQNGDLDAAISRQKQQEITVQAIREFLALREN